MFGSTTNEGVGGDDGWGRNRLLIRARRKIRAERQVSVSGKGTLQSGRGNIDGLAIEKGMGDRFDASAFGRVEVVVKMIVRVVDQDVVRILGVDEASLELGLLVGRQSQDVGIGARPQPAAWSHERDGVYGQDDGDGG